MALYLDALVSAAPVAVLVWLMVKRSPWPSSRALPLSALLLYLLKLAYFASPANGVNATLLTGMLTALTPVFIIWGAILLFSVMERSGGMAIVRQWLNGTTSNRVAQLMIIGWAFSFLIEGASGFGTPAALAAPLLVGLGFEPLKAALFCLVMNSVPVSFGAVGTPTWFGLGQLGLDEAEIAAIGWKTALMHAAAALAVPPLALRLVLPGSEVRRNLRYVYASILACALPYVLIARGSYEFPALAAGLIGFMLSVWLARRGWGLDSAAGKTAPEGTERVGFAALAKALFPLWGCVVVLVATRVEYFGLKGWLNDMTALARGQIGTLGEAFVSVSGAVGLNDVFGSGIGWSMKTLYIPAFIPFFLVAGLTAAWWRMPLRGIGNALGDSARMMKSPAISLAGALALVGLLLGGGEQSCAQTIGRAAAELAGTGWFFCAPYLGALGSFFAGSNTVSNLTFGGIQQSVAQSLGLDVTTILALQSVGGAMGNMVCINNIVAVGSILGLSNEKGYEGKIIRRTFPLVVLYGAVALIAALAM